MNKILEFKKWLEEYHEYCYNNSQLLKWNDSGDELIKTNDSLKNEGKAEVIAQILNRITETFKIIETGDCVNKTNIKNCPCGELYHKHIKLSTMQYKYCPECGVKL